MMSLRFTRAFMLAGALLVLAAVNYSIYGKERVIGSGETIYLELAPVDPRSIMQGDYMALRFRLAETIEASLLRAAPTATQRAAVVLDHRRVATLSAATGDSALHIRYRIRNGTVWLGTNAYFFEEGTASRFADARYGEFRLDRSSGEAVLVGLRDVEMRAL